MGACTTPPKEINDWEKQELKGKVKSVRTVNLKANERESAKREITSSSYSEFNENGYLTRLMRDYFTQGEFSSSSETHYYYEDNMLKRTESDNGTTFTYKYISPTEIEHYSSWGGAPERETKRFDKSGYLIESKIESTIDNTYNCNKYTYTYDNKKNLISKSWYFISNLGNNKDSLRNKTEYQYSSNNQLIKTISETYGSILELSETIHKYDDKGNIVSEMVNEEKGNSKQSFFITYEYDSQNNWIRRAVYNNERDYLPLHELQREINYYSTNEPERNTLSGVIAMLKKEKEIKQYCNEDIARGLTFDYMNMNYPDWEICTEINVSKIDNCIFNIRFQVINPHRTYPEYDIIVKEQIVAELSIIENYTKYQFQLKRGLLY
ncbi:hypothetical protein D0T53_13225 [Dysgonomonas sp. 216]|nr:hypothetical protein [Dysgonomonas sp. 216]